MRLPVLSPLADIRIDFTNSTSAIVTYARRAAQAFAKSVGISLMNPPS